jgi:SOS-response transcriptional repressor LexA
MDIMEDVITGGFRMNDELTQKQKDLLEVICIYIDKNKIAPTNRELMDLFELKSTSTMHGYLCRLRDKGYITWQEGMSRTIQILKRD